MELAIYYTHGMLQSQNKQTQNKQILFACLTNWFDKLNEK